MHHRARKKQERVYHIRSNNCTPSFHCRTHGRSEPTGLSDPLSQLRIRSLLFSYATRPPIGKSNLSPRNFPDTELRILQLLNDNDTKLSTLSLRPSSVTSVAMMRRRSSLQRRVRSNNGACGTRSQFGVFPTYSVRESVRLLVTNWTVPTGLCWPVCSRAVVGFYRFPPS